MLLLLLIYVVLRALWKINGYIISTLVNKSLYIIIINAFLRYVYVCSKHRTITVVAVHISARLEQA